MDLDFSQRLCFEELQLGLKRYGMDISEDDINLLFVWFDKDENQTIDFCEFIQRLRPPMSENRRRVISEAFDKLDINSDNELKTDDLKGSVSFRDMTLRCYYCTGADTVIVFGTDTGNLEANLISIKDTDRIFNIFV
ncbi:hypothetical protein KUTeg_003443 [Tegillarca granosa]|uniref:Uncharacterized protein n=1 Tax=Tegillarca granosa TaxID=220873 RepID=A0ABQ9FM49_TEGGR|nr:hypothetical protein KUTeg_003443 [Tegillarca granosa]